MVVPARTPLFVRLLAVLLAVGLVACSDESTGTTVDESSITSSTSGSQTGGQLGPDGSPTTTFLITTTIPTPTTLPQDNPLVQAELTVEVDGATILFDQRPFTLMDGSGRVQVIAPNGDILAEGPFEGDDSIMNQVADGSFEFVNAAGAVVATMTQEQLNDALDAVTPG